MKLFQHYAQASCLATAFTEGEIHDQAVSALNGYREFGAMPLEAYEALVAPIQQWLFRPAAARLKDISRVSEELILEADRSNLA